jgi:hypothetical protein
VENLKYFGEALRSKDSRMKKMRGNEFGVMLTTAP